MMNFVWNHGSAASAAPRQSDALRRASTGFQIHSDAHATISAPTVSG
jgi:hypothetical protein